MPKKKVTKLKKKEAVMKKNPLKPKKKVAKTSKAKAKAKSKKKVAAIPKGHSSIAPYLILNDAAKAIDFYKSIFGAKEVYRMEHEAGKVGHAELKIGDARIMLADENPQTGALGPHAFSGSAISIHLYIKNVDVVVEKAIENGAKLLRPVQDMFYGDRSGSVQDPFGHTWFISTHIEDVTPAKMKKRAAQLYKTTGS